VPCSASPSSAGGLALGEEDRAVRDRCRIRLLQGKKRVRVRGGGGEGVLQNVAYRMRAQGRFETVDVQPISERWIVSGSGHGAPEMRRGPC